MGRKSSIEKAPPPIRSRIEQIMRENRLTLDETIAAIRAEFGSAPSRSALHRYKEGFAEMTGRMREIEAASAAMVGELGEGVGEKAGALLAQAVTTLATHAALKANAQMDDVSIDEIRKLARAAKDVIDTRRISLAERQTIEREARERMVREGKRKLDAMGASGEISPDVLARVIAAAYAL